MNEPTMDPDKEQERLDALGQRIERSRTEIDDEDPATDHRRTYVESFGEVGESAGEGEEGEDDQTIVPPG